MVSECELVYSPGRKRKKKAAASKEEWQELQEEPEDIGFAQRCQDKKKQPWQEDVRKWPTEFAKTPWENVEFHQRRNEPYDAVFCLIESIQRLV